MESLLYPYRALDLTDEKGSFCGKILADLGCDVIKIEPPGGDMSRSIGPFYRDIPDPEKSLYWFGFNTSKRGITLNLKIKDGGEIFKRLVKTADFVMESFAPGYLDSIELGYQILSTINPKIIMTSITPFGQSGPYKDYKASDIIVMATGGQMTLCGDPDRAPLRCSIDQSYPHAGAQAVIGTLFALYYRNLTGEGQWVDVSMQECVLATTWSMQSYWDINKVLIKRQGTRVARGSIAVRNVFPCKDGYISWRIFTAQQAPMLRALIDWMDENGMAGELKHINWEQVDMNKVQQEQIDRWEEIFAKFFLNHTKEELYVECSKRGAMLFPVNNPKDLLKNEQLKAREFWEEVEHPELGVTITYPGAPFKSSEAGWRISRRAPLVGEHNEDIYEGELGFSKEELAVLKRRNVI